MNLKRFAWLLTFLALISLSVSAKKGVILRLADDVDVSIYPAKDDSV